MERKEMVKLIEEIRLNYGLVTDEEEFADFLLEKMEEAGMNYTGDTNCFIGWDKKDA